MNNVTKEPTRKLVSMEEVFFKDTPAKAIVREGGSNIVIKDVSDDLGGYVARDITFVPNVVTSLVIDLFNGVTGTNLISHTPDEDSVGGGWIYSSSGGGAVRADITGGNALRPNWSGTSDDRDHAHIDAGETDVEFIVNERQNSPGGTVMRMYLRRRSSTSYVYIEWDRGAPGTVKFKKRISSSSPTTEATEAITVSNTASKEFKVVVVGSNYQAQIDGVIVLQHTDSYNIGQSNFGIFVPNGASNIRYEDFTVDG